MATTEVTPAGVASLATLKVAIVPTIAVLTAPTVAEIGAGVNFAFYVPGSDLGVTLDQDTGQDVRLGSSVVFDQFGQEHITIDDLRYIFDPQTPGSSNPAAVFVDGYSGYLVRRYGLAVGTDWVAAQKVKVDTIKLGGRIESKTSDDQFGLWCYVQKIITTGTSNVSATIAA
jgi:hypothetical protein